MTSWKQDADKHGRVQSWWQSLPDEVLTETAWERQMNYAGIDKFEISREKSTASETSTGQRMMHEMIEVATNAIEDMQRRVLRDNSKGQRSVKGTAIILPPDSCALITLRSLINRTYAAKKPDEGYTYQILCKEVARAIETELNFRHWIIESRKQAKEYAESAGLKTIPKSIAERLMEEEGLTRMTKWRWKQTFEELSEYRWDTLELHYCGDALVNAVIEALPETFEIHLVGHAAKKAKFARMTEEARESFNASESRLAQMQVWKKPMIARPKPWTATETIQ